MKFYKKHSIHKAIIEQVKYTYCFLILFFVFFNSCKKSVVPVASIPSYESFSKLEWIWSGTEISYDYYFSEVLGINSRGDVLNYRKVGSRDYYELNDATTGDRIWVFEGYIDEWESDYEPKIFSIKNDVFIINTSKAVSSLSGKLYGFNF